MRPLHLPKNAPKGETYPYAVEQSERGQAIVLLVLMMVGFLGVTALAVDGGHLYYSQRTAQNAADNAALAGAFAICSGGAVGAAALGAAANNGFNNDGSTNTVTVNHPPASGPYAGNPDYVEVLVNGRQEPAFAQVVFSGDLEVTARAVAVCLTEQTGEYAIFADSESCETPIVDHSGSQLLITGDVHSNGDIKVGGSDIYFDGNVTYVDSLQAGGGNVTYNPPPPNNPTQTGVRPMPVDFDIADYAPGGSAATAADSNGEYYYCDCERIDLNWLRDQGLYNEVTDVLADGLYYTTGYIDLSASDLVANAATFVARDEITLSGSSIDIDPYVDSLLLFTDLDQGGANSCEKFNIKISGSDSQWSGIVYSPYGMIEMSGSGNASFQGSLIGFAVKLSGSQVNIQYNAAFFPPQSPVIELSE